jgi:hypothetical protein
MVLEGFGLVVHGRRTSRRPWAFIVGLASVACRHPHNQWPSSCTTFGDTRAASPVILRGVESHHPIKGDYVPGRFRPPSVVTLEIAGRDIHTLTERLTNGSHGPVHLSGGPAPDPSSGNRSQWYSWVLVSAGISSDSLRVTAIDDDRFDDLAETGQPLWREVSVPIPGALEEQERTIERLRKQREELGRVPSGVPAAGPTHERVWRRVGSVVGRVPTPKVIADTFDLTERHRTRMGIDGPYRSLDPSASNPRPTYWHDAWIREDDQSLVIHASGGIHEEPHSIVIDDSEDHVTVTLMVGDSDHVGPRIGIAHTWWFEVRLPRPLHHRFLRDGDEV